MLIVMSLGDGRKLVAGYAEHRAVLEDVADNGAGIPDQLIPRLAAALLVDLRQSVHPAEGDGVVYVLPALDLAVEVVRHVFIGVFVLYACQDVQMGPASCGGEPSLILLFTPDLRIDVGDPDDQLRAVLLLDQGRLEAGIARLPVDVHPVAHREDAVLPDFLHDPFLRDHLLEACDILRPENTLALDPGCGIKIVALPGDVEAGIVRGRPVLHIAVRIRIDRIDADIIAGQGIDARIGDLLGLQPGHLLLLPHLRIHVADADDDMPSVRRHAHGLHTDVDRILSHQLAIAQRKGAPLVQRAQDVLLGKGLEKILSVFLIDEHLRIFCAGAEEVGSAPLHRQVFTAGIRCVFDEFLGFKVDIIEVHVVR